MKSILGTTALITLFCVAVIAITRGTAGTLVKNHTELMEATEEQLASKVLEEVRPYLSDVQMETYDTYKRKVDKWVAENKALPNNQGPPELTGRSIGSMHIAPYQQLLISVKDTMQGLAQNKVYPSGTGVSTPTDTPLYRVHFRTSENADEKALELGKVMYALNTYEKVLETQYPAVNVYERTAPWYQELGIGVQDSYKAYQYRQMHLKDAVVQLDPLQ